MTGGATSADKKEEIKTCVSFSAVLAHSTAVVVILVRVTNSPRHPSRPKKKSEATDGAGFRAITVKIKA